MSDALQSGNDLHNLALQFAYLKGQLENGLTARVRVIERMQWWQLGALVSIIVLVLVGMFAMFNSARSEKAAVLERLDRHLSQSAVNSGSAGATE